jgi:hypothetical protein
MASNAELEKAIKRYSDVFETVLLGMHQELHAQQHTVEKKLESWNTHAGKRSEEIDAARAEAVSAAEEMQTRVRSLVAQETSRLGKDREGAMAEVRAACEQFASSVDSTARDMKGMLDEAHKSSTRQYGDVRRALEQTKDVLAQSCLAHQQTLEVQARGVGGLLMQIRAESDKALRAIQQAQHEHQVRVEAFHQAQRAHQARVEAFARQTRKLILAAAGIGVALIVASLWMR